MPFLPSEIKIVPGIMLVGKYRVTREIGRGGMAAVYEVEHVTLRRKVALKVLAAELAASSVVIERFFREARAAASVRSPYIVDVTDSGRLEDGRPFIAMELLVGESLYDRMARVRLLDPVTVAKILVCCARGLAKAHDAGIVHRDLKPENIFLTKMDNGEEIAKILDFGLAKFYTPVHQDERAARLTREGAVFGTPAYMSPEQVKGDGAVDHRADLWALGCMAFECLTGRPVWNTDQGVAMTFAAIAASDPPVPSSLRSDLPRSFDAWFKRALSRDAGRRFQSAKELSDALLRALGVSPVALIHVNEHGELDMEAALHAAEELPSEVVRLDSSIPPPPEELPDGGGLPPGANLRLGMPPDLSRAEEPTQADLPGLADYGPPVPPPTEKSGSTVLRTLGLSILGASVLAAGLFMLQRTRDPKPANNLGATSSSGSLAPSSATPSSAATAPVSAASVAALAPNYPADVAEAQGLLEAGSVERAQDRLTESAQRGNATARGLLEQLKEARLNIGPCTLKALSHPRGPSRVAFREHAVVAGDRGAVALWTEEADGRRHTYSVSLDGAGRPLRLASDVTPEAESVEAIRAVRTGSRILLVYIDKGVADGSVRARMLTTEGHVDSASQGLGGKGSSARNPSVTQVPGGFVVTWADSRDSVGDDLFYARTTSELSVIGKDLRATDYVPSPTNGRSAHVQTPVASATDDSLFLAFVLERDRRSSVRRMLVPFDLPDYRDGLPAKPPLVPLPGGGTERPKDREIGAVAPILEKGDDGASPTAACLRDGCYVAWQGKPHGITVAGLDRARGLLLWSKLHAPTGFSPALASAPTGGALLSWGDGERRLRVAGIRERSLGTASTIGRLGRGSDLSQVAMTVAAGLQRGEWLVSYADTPNPGTRELYVSRVVCE